MNRLLKAVWSLFIFSLLGSVAAASTIVVPTDQPTIQSAIDSALSGDTVLVGPGAWLVQLDFGGKGLVLVSQAGPTATVLQPISPDSQIIRISSGEPAGTEIDGFTFRGGSGNSQVVLGGSARVLIRNCVFERYDGADAVVRCDGAGVRLERNVLYDNNGLACIGIYSDTVLILNCTLDHNAAGVFVLDGVGQVRNSIITFSTQYGLRGDAVISDYNVVWNNTPNFDAGSASGANDLFADPGFVAPGSNDFTLRDTSICIDAGDPDSLYLDPDSSRNDIGALPLGTIVEVLPIPTAVNIAGLSLSRVVDAQPVISWRYYDSVGSYSGYELEIGSDNDWTIAEMWATGQVLQPDTTIICAGTPLLISTTYYLRLRLTNGAAWGDWRTLGFRTNTPPLPPQPLQPLNRDSVHIANVVLAVLNGSDGDADALTYDFFVYADSLLTEIVAVDSGVIETPGITSCSPIAGLAADSTYWWQARVSDRFEYSDWSDTGSFVAFQGPRTIRVPSEQPTIQAAVAAASSGDSILVADGIYSGDGNRVISFGTKNLVMLSENGPAATIIDCGDTLGGPYDGIRITGGQDSTTVVRGFTIRNAENAVVLEASPRLQQLILETNNRGVFTFGSLKSTMDSLIIRDNQTGISSEDYADLTLHNSFIVSNGSGIYLSEGDLALDSCRLDSNTIGIELLHASATLDRCRLAHNATGVRSNVGPVVGLAKFTDCVLDSNGVAVYGDSRLQSSTVRGGQVGIDLAFPDHANLDTVTVTGMTETALRHLLNPRSSLPVGSEAHTGTPGFLVRHCQITDNPGFAANIESAQDGDYNVLQLDSTVIANNGGGLNIGGALSMYGSLYIGNGGPLNCVVNDYVYNRRKIEACTFANNDSGAIRITADSAILEIHRTIVAYNAGVGIAYDSKDSSRPRLLCNNVFENAGGNYTGIIDSVAIADNLSMPPHFCDLSSQNFDLYDISPCAATNNACSTVIGARDIVCINVIPQITSPDTVTVFEDSMLVYRIVYVDTDGPDTSVQVTGIPSWLTLSADSLFGTPTESVPDTTFLIIVGDGYAADTQLVVVDVVPVNDPPVLDSIEIPTQVQLDTLTLYFSATDSESDSLTLSVEPLPTGAGVIDSGNGSAVLVWVVDTVSEGQVELAFIAADSSKADTVTVSVTVRSRRPVILGITVDGLDSNLRVVNHTPLISWTYFDSVFGYDQSEFEIAVGTDTDWASAETWNPAPVASAESSVVFNGAPLLDGSTYYLRLRAKNDTLYSMWHEDSLRMNRQPTPPGVTDSGEVTSYDNLQPTIFAGNSQDTDDDPLFYEFRLFADSLLDSLVDSISDVTEQPDSTGWAVGAVLEESHLYWWRARSTDGYEYSDWSLSAAFFVDITPQAPLPFAAVALPIDSGGILFEMLPTFQWERAVDPDLFDSVVYHMHLAQDSLFTISAFSDTVADTVFALTDSLQFDSRYWWRLEAIDLTGNATACTTVLSFYTWTLGDMDSSHTVSLTDLTRLVNYLFVTFEPIVPFFAADLNASCTVTLTDITILVNYLFQEGDMPLPGCAPPPNRE